MSAQFSRAQFTDEQRQQAEAKAAELARNSIALLRRENARSRPLYRGSELLAEQAWIVLPAYYEHAGICLGGNGKFYRFWEIGFPGSDAEILRSLNRDYEIPATVLVGKKEGLGDRIYAQLVRTYEKRKRA